MRGIFFLFSFLFLTAHSVSANVDVTEKLGSSLPSNITLKDESGVSISFGQYIDKPTIFAPIFFSCANVCPLNLSGIAKVLSEMTLLEAGKDFQVAAISFDKNDLPETALEKKKNYITAIGKPFPDKAWKFFTGDQKNIDLFLNSIGFEVEKIDSMFDHPVALVVASADGKIVRYLYGLRHLPLDVTMAINEAANGKIGSTANRVLNYCFAYDPAKKRYVFNILKVTGTVTVASLLAFALFLLYGKQTKRAL